MSYILDALRRSESERQQGRVPDLAHSVQMVHKPKRRAIPVGVWVALALFFNGAILAVIFWPGSGFLASTVDEHASESVTQTEPETKPGQAQQASPAKTQTATDADTEKETNPAPVTEVPAEQAFAEAPQSPPAVPVEGAERPESPTRPAEEPMLITPSTADEELYPEAQAGPGLSEEPTLIVPSQRESGPGNAGQQTPAYDFADGPPVQHLVEKPLAFQRSIPDLRFSSHIYASDPAARRVMINDHYLRPGDTFSGIRVEAITADGVVLSAYGETFRVGVVRDWISPR
ncbi:hypothetical protein RE428_26540 [Marinobacter nanhaiticus D15-8W]|uniref:Type II secretion system protein GspB C-terminal domain-containing protein n=1 Tax=Marinobacter nanhaiticus D15-8W TaxID=626887 RepID=N6W2C9_9GAMM|nr:general secretion pathway protein GspB [Marinobacter nanhaiticus]ENO14249.1 hypothetical protein J057_22685 [Marinobacter nanhaiticus D15-8W]BES71636.1 hypothetical protein RE428_26540 [Marinobacter nanhaiticus D15-8W]